MNGNRIVEFDVTSEGLVQGPGFHDGSLHGMVTVGTDVVLTTANYRGELYELKLVRVAAMAANNFWENNTIGEVFWWKVEHVPEPFLRRLFLRRFPIDYETEGLRAWLQQRHSSHVFGLECAYGAEITAGCDALVITSRGQPARS